MIFWGEGVEAGLLQLARVTKTEGNGRKDKKQQQCSPTGLNAEQVTKCVTESSDYASHKSHVLHWLKPRRFFLEANTGRKLLSEAQKIHQPNPNPNPNPAICCLTGTY